MKLIIDSVSKDLTPFIEGFRKYLNYQDVVTYESAKDSDEIVTAVVWNHRPDLFKRFPNVKLVASLGAGVDHILKDKNIPKHAKITRIISEELSRPMSNFCIGAVMYFHRKFDQYAKEKPLKLWHQEYNPERDLKIGILGLGELGCDLAVKLTYLGFQVSGYSQSHKQIPGVKSYNGGQLDEFLAETNCLICLLPATPQTKGILNLQLFQKMPKSSFLINVARGHHQDDNDIVKALDLGYLKGAFLDVFPQEPLPFDSPLWEHPDVFITPHIAVVTKLEAAVPQIAENHKRMLAGKELLNLIDIVKGY